MHICGFFFFFKEKYMHIFCVFDQFYLVSLWKNNSWLCHQIQANNQQPASSFANKKAVYTCIKWTAKRINSNAQVARAFLELINLPFTVSPNTGSSILIIHSIFNALFVSIFIMHVSRINWLKLFDTQSVEGLIEIRATYSKIKPPLVPKYDLYFVVSRIIFVEGE